MGNSKSKTGSSSLEPEPPAVGGLPEGEISNILGLLELLKSKGGHEDIYKLAGELSMEAGQTLSVIRGAELLGLVHTPGGDVVLQPFGNEISKASVSERKELIANKIQQIPVFRSIREFLTQQGEEVPKNVILEKLVDLVPNENVEKSFDTVVAWGRYAELFGYNDDSEIFYLDNQEN